jgi:hypothetical protein
MHGYQKRMRDVRAERARSKLVRQPKIYFYLGLDDF